MKLLTALQKEARKLTKVKADVELQLNAIGAAVKAFGSTLAAESGNGRKKRGRKPAPPAAQPSHAAPPVTTPSAARSAPSAVHDGGQRYAEAVRLLREVLAQTRRVPKRRSAFRVQSGSTSTKDSVRGAKGQLIRLIAQGRIICEIRTDQNALQWGVPPNPVEASGSMMNS